MDSEFWAAIVGAIIGGGMTVVAQFLASHWQNNRHRSSVSHHLLLKLIHIHRDISNVLKYLDDGFRDANDGAPLFLAVKPIIGEIRHITIEYDELHALLELKDDDLTNNIINIDYKHSLLRDMVYKFNEMRNRLSQISTPLVNPWGDIAVRIHDSYEDEFQYLAIRINLLLREWVDILKNDKTTTEWCFKSLNSDLRRYFGLRIRFRIKS
ncbi:hypothetical protein [Consotaella aegiceratis]|uniref:hypothetical protein n=1 Tax=Consotaella aegiceratis TaxID=3097961 RepID=UPI002F3F72C2